MTTPRDPRATPRDGFSTGSRQNEELTAEHYTLEESVGWDWREVADLEGRILVDTPWRWPDIFKAVKSREISWDDVARRMSHEEIEEMCLIVKGDRKPPPAYIPAAFKVAVKKEINARGFDEISGVLPAALRTLKKLMDDPDTKAADRAKIAVWFAERNLGKTPERVEVEHTVKPWEKILEDGVTFESDAIEGEIVAHVHDYSARELPESTFENPA